MNAVVLYPIDPEKRMQRYYRMDIQPNLFGEWCLMREWGRIGSSGQTRSLPFSTPAGSDRFADSRAGEHQPDTFGNVELVM